MHRVGQAIQRYQMIQDGDRIMVCISGGKDSLTMLEILMALQRKAPVRFELVAVCLDQGFPGFPADAIRDFMVGQDISFKLIRENTRAIIDSVLSDETPGCSLCARLRRGILYTTAHKLGLNKVALGHHRDDVIETLFLNLFYTGRIRAIPPKYLTESEQHIVIRPLFSVRERDIEAYAAKRPFPQVPADLCGKRQNAKRQTVKNMLAAWELEDPGRLDVVFSSLGRLEIPFLADPQAYDFGHLEARCRPLDGVSHRAHRGKGRAR